MYWHYVQCIKFSRDGKNFYFSSVNISHTINYPWRFFVMNKSSKILSSASAACLLSAAIGLAATSATAHAKPDDTEKCAGIVKAGQNDCGANGHGCAGYADTDGDPNEWVFMPKGLCDKIVGAKVVDG
jgi:uncharacterized membrane protein